MRVPSVTQIDLPTYFEGILGSLGTSQKTEFCRESPSQTQSKSIRLAMSASKLFKETKCELEGTGSF
jgi:hypothetical protein